MSHRPDARTADLEQSEFQAAVAGDREAFDRLVAPLRAELHRHCYRMTGSLDDADDLVQDTFLRAWRSIGTYAGRSSFRAWLYRIATNCSLDVLNAKARREVVIDWQRSDGVLEPLWMQPYSDEGNPVLSAERSERLSVAFVVALQRLTSRQRTSLLLRDVVGFSAAETAEVMGTSVASVNSALQRARSKSLELQRPDMPTGQLAAVRDRLIDAWRVADFETLASLFSDDVTMSMPPLALRIDGCKAVLEFLANRAPDRRLELMPVQAVVASGLPALAVYTRDEQSRPTPLTIATISGPPSGGIDRFTAFLVPQHFERFGLSPTPSDRSWIQTEKVPSNPMTLG